MRPTLAVLFDSGSATAPDLGMAADSLGECMTRPPGAPGLSTRSPLWTESSPPSRRLHLAVPAPGRQMAISRYLPDSGFGQALDAAGGP
ncbi:hypothetical protein BDK92_5475 [Micromonospora pisi]|uniref:Uncharacterized protein n=1 Tax=Micromonospora pisi TaxID=589240 RepID=A0A495JQ08_9ACTN|nr:hypothetical protein BDK92_5475 [Micromonospora pisi]